MLDALMGKKPAKKTRVIDLTPKKKGGIHIQPSHKGLLHKDLGVKPGKKLTVKEEMKAKHSSDPAERKRATFALNARKWNHKG